MLHFSATATNLVYNTSIDFVVVVVVVVPMDVVCLEGLVLVMQDDNAVWKVDAASSNKYTSDDRTNKLHNAWHNACKLSSSSSSSSPSLLSVSLSLSNDAVMAN